MDTQPYVLVSRSPAAVVEDQFIRLFKRCVQCPPTTPSCGCAPGQSCSLFPASCQNCQYTVCSGTPTNSGPPVAAIAGGVVGGVFILAVIIFLAYWFRKKRHIEYPPEDDQYEEEWQQMQQEKEEMDRHSSRMNHRMSTRTMASVASSAASGRTSNIIQIAYIPGVTNRSQSTPDLIPPVPPIPAASGGSSRASQGTSTRASPANEFLFMPADLRNSTYSGYSGHGSLAASRTSFASTAYRSDAVVDPMPAKAINLRKPTHVSVKTGSKPSSTLSRSSSPPPGSSSSGQPQLNTKSSIVGKFAQPRTITVTRKPSNSLKPHGFNAFELDGSDQSVSSAATSLHQRSGPASPKSNAASTFEYGSDGDDANSQHTHLVELPANRRTMTTSIVPLNEDPVELSDSSRHSSIPRAIQDSMMKAMQINMGPAPETSPFSDVHESRTP